MGPIVIDVGWKGEAARELMGSQPLADPAAAILRHPGERRGSGAVLLVLPGAALHLADSDLGTRQVEDLLNKLEYSLPA